MALEKGVNSYVTLVEAESFFVNKLDVAAWNDASDIHKEQALVTATQLLDTLDWIGVVLEETQLLAFPRYAFYFDPKLGYDIQLSEEIPKRITLGTFELAYHLLNNDGLLDDTGTVTDLTIGSIALKIRTDPSKIPNSVRRQIKPLLRNSTNLWWRAN
jgi:hypothetical protein